MLVFCLRKGIFHSLVHDACVEVDFLRDVLDGVLYFRFTMDFRGCVWMAVGEGKKRGA